MALVKKKSSIYIYIDIIFFIFFYFFFLPPFSAPPADDGAPSICLYCLCPGPALGRPVQGLHWWGRGWGPGLATEKAGCAVSDQGLNVSMSIPGHHTRSRHRCLSLTMPKWPSCAIARTCARRTLGTTVQSPRATQESFQHEVVRGP